MDGEDKGYVGKPEVDDSKEVKNGIQVDECAEKQYVKESDEVNEVKKEKDEANWKAYDYQSDEDHRGPEHGVEYRDEKKKDHWSQEQKDYQKKKR